MLGLNLNQVKGTPAILRSFAILGLVVSWLVKVDVTSMAHDWIWYETDNRFNLRHPKSREILWDLVFGHFKWGRLCNKVTQNRLTCFWSDNVIQNSWSDLAKFRGNSRFKFAVPGRSSKLQKVSQLTPTNIRSPVLQCCLDPDIRTAFLGTVCLACGANVLGNWQLAEFPQSEHCEWYHSIEYESSLGASWWRHQMETFFALLALCAGNSPVPGEFPAHRPVTRSFDVFFDMSLYKRLSKQWWGWWFQTLSRPLWRHCNVCSLYVIPRAWA